MDAQQGKEGFLTALRVVLLPSVAPSRLARKRGHSLPHRGWGCLVRPDSELHGLYEA